MSWATVEHIPNNNSNNHVSIPKKKKENTSHNFNVEITQNKLANCCSDRTLY